MNVSEADDMIEIIKDMTSQVASASTSRSRVYNKSANGNGNISSIERRRYVILHSSIGSSF